MKLTYQAVVRNNLLKLPSFAIQELAKFEGKSIYVTIEEWRNTRSLQQNRYYWGVVIKLISDHTGFDSLETHEVLKYKFNSKLTELVNVKSGEIEIIEHGGTTTRMTTLEFMEYIGKIQQWAAEFLALSIPGPNENFQ
jgi:hypothetical protein